jgi:hypothetical protein
MSLSGWKNISESFWRTLIVGLNVALKGLSLQRDVKSDY